MIQLIKKRKKRNKVIGLSDLNRWSSTIIDFLLKTISVSAKDLT